MTSRYNGVVQSSELVKGGDSICPHAVHLFDQTKNDVKEAIEKAKDFHQRGGSLVSIENYLDSHMQSTVTKLKLGFEYNEKDKDSTNPEPTKVIESLNQYYQTHDVKRGGYGQPLPGKWTGQSAEKNGPLFLQRWINVIEPDTAERYRVAIGNIGPECMELIHFAENTYEEKLICVPPAKMNDPVQHEKIDDCHFFSVGSNDQWGFEQEVLQKLPNCVTHTFDCTLANNTPRRKPNSDNVKFYPYCIGDGTQNSDTNDESAVKTSKEFLPYSKLWEHANIERAPKFLKIDVEGFEFGVIPHMLRSSPQETWPEQIMVEIHWATRMVDNRSVLRTRQASEMALFFGQLFNQGGYLPVFVKYFEPHCATCLEVLFVRVLCTADA